MASGCSMTVGTAQVGADPARVTPSVPDPTSPPPFPLYLYLCLYLYPPSFPPLCSAEVALGVLPPAADIASRVSLDQQQPAIGVTQSLATLPALLTAMSGLAPTSGLGTSTAKQGQAVVLSSALPPITAKLAAKITSGQFVAMKELLADNMALCHQLEAFPAHQHLCTGGARPRLREIDSPLTWASCFLAYAAVCATDTQTRNLLTYGRLVVREAQRHSGPGWLEYDRIFRQHAALSPSTVWHELNPSLHAATVLSYRVGPGAVCSVCHEPDLSSETCAMQVLQPQEKPAMVQQSPPVQAQQSAPRGVSSIAGNATRRPTRPETLERICISWNKGRCTFPSCRFRHICATCKGRGHRAKECQQTPAESLYKAQPSTSQKAGGDGSGQQA